MLVLQICNDSDSPPAVDPKPAICCVHLQFDLFIFIISTIFYIKLTSTVLQLQFDRITQRVFCIFNLAGQVVMDLSGFTEQGFKQKLAVQALFGKILYLLEVSLSMLLLTCNYHSSWSFTLK
jgi:hypothetical protein